MIFIIKYLLCSLSLFVFALIFWGVSLLIAKLHNEGYDFDGMSRVLITLGLWSSFLAVILYVIFY